MVVIIRRQGKVVGYVDERGRQHVGSPNVTVITPIGEGGRRGLSTVYLGSAGRSEGVMGSIDTRPSTVITPISDTGVRGRSSVYSPEGKKQGEFQSVQPGVVARSERIVRAGGFYDFGTGLYVRNPAAESSEQRAERTGSYFGFGTGKDLPKNVEYSFKESVGVSGQIREPYRRAMIVEEAKGYGIPSLRIDYQDRSTVEGYVGRALALYEGAEKKASGVVLSGMGELRREVNPRNESFFSPTSIGGRFYGGVYKEISERPLLNVGLYAAGYGVGKLLAGTGKIAYGLAGGSVIAQKVIRWGEFGLGAGLLGYAGIGVYKGARESGDWAGYLGKESVRFGSFYAGTRFRPSGILTIGKREIAAESLIEPEVLSGAKTFPTSRASPSGLRREFLTSKYKEPIKEIYGIGSGGFHATISDFGKSGEFGAGERASKGLFISPSLSAYFLRLGKNQATYGFGVFPKGGRPLAAFVETDVGLIPKGYRGSLGRMQSYFVSERFVGSGRAAISPEFYYGKGEAEAIVAMRSRYVQKREGFNWWERVSGFREYVKVEGKVVPIKVYSTGTGGRGISVGKIVEGSENYLSGSKFISSGKLGSYYVSKNVFRSSYGMSSSVSSYGYRGLSGGYPGSPSVKYPSYPGVSKGGYPGSPSVKYPGYPGVSKGGYPGSPSVKYPGYPGYAPPVSPPVFPPVRGRLRRGKGKEVRSFGGGLLSWGGVYAPSVEAEVLGIRGRPSKWGTLSGLGIRPLLVR